MSDLCDCDAVTSEVHEHCLNCDCILGSQGDEEHLCFVCSGGSYTGRPRPADMPALKAVKRPDGAVELVMRD